MSELKHLPSHPEVREAVKRPMVFVAGKERTVIPKDAILCDLCNATIAGTHGVEPLDAHVHLPPCLTLSI